MGDLPSSLSPGDPAWDKDTGGLGTDVVQGQCHNAGTRRAHPSRHSRYPRAWGRRAAPALVPTRTWVLEGRASPLKGPPREGGIAHLPLRLRTSAPSSPAADGQRDGWTWQSTVCGPTPPWVGTSPTPRGPTCTAPHILHCGFGPISLTRTIKPRPQHCWHQWVPKEGSSLRAARLGSAGMAP